MTTTQQETAAALWAEFDAEREARKTRPDVIEYERRLGVTCAAAEAYTARQQEAREAWTTYETKRAELNRNPWMDWSKTAAELNPLLILAERAQVAESEAREAYRAAMANQLPYPEAAAVRLREIMAQIENLPTE